MYNPYVSHDGPCLTPVPRPHSEPRQPRHHDNPAGSFSLRLISHLRRLDRDDLLIIAILYLLLKDDNCADLWPLLAILIYILLD